MNVINIIEKDIRIAIFGLSGNPPTGIGGHAGVVRHLVNTNSFDEIWILPVYRHSYSSKSSLVLYDHRVNMCRLNFESESTNKCIVKVLTLEKEVYEHILSLETKKCSNSNIPVPTISMGSIDIIKYILNQISSNNINNVSLPRISLVLGSDTYNDLMSGKWKNGAE